MPRTRLRLQDDRRWGRVSCLSLLRVLTLRVATKKSLKAKCDKLWSEIIRSIGYCEMCGSNQNLQAHHIMGRINYSLRWDLRNGICLDASCHTFSRNSAHNSPLEFAEWFKANRPEDYEYLLSKKNLLVKPDYEQILNYLQSEVK